MSFLGGTGLAGSAVGAAGMAAAGPVGWVGLAANLLGGSGMFGGSDPETNTSAAYSGIGGFKSDNQFDFSYSKPIIDLDDPMQVLVAGGLLVLAIYTWKKVK